MRLRKPSILVITVVTAAFLAFDVYRVSLIPPVPERLPSHRVHPTDPRTGAVFFPDETSLRITDITARRPDFTPGLPAYPATEENYATWDVNGIKKEVPTDIALGMNNEPWKRGNRCLRVRVEHSEEPFYYPGTEYRIAGKVRESIGHSSSYYGWTANVDMELPASMRRASFWMGSPDEKRTVTLTQLPLVPFLSRRLGAQSVITPIRKEDLLLRYHEAKITVGLPVQLRPASENLYHYVVQTVNIAGLVNQGGYAGDVVIDENTASIDLSCGVRAPSSRVVAVRVILMPYRWGEFSDVPLPMPEAKFAF